MPAFDAASSAFGSIADLQWTHTPVAVPQLAVVLVWNSLLQGVTVTYGGVACSLVVQQAGVAQAAEIFALLSPPPGAQTVSVSDPFANAKVAGAMTFLNAGFPVSGVGAEEADADVTLTVPNTLATDIVVQVAGNEANRTHTPQSGQTEAWDLNSDGAGYYKTADAGSTALRITIASGTLITCACKIPSAPSGNQVIILQFRRMQRFFDDLKRGLIPPHDLRRRYREVCI